MFGRIIIRFFLAVLLLSAILAIFFISLAPWGKEGRQIISGQDAAGREAWAFLTAARGAMIRKYKIFVDANCDAALCASTYMGDGIEAGQQCV